ncbi:MAG: membrane-binding protein [Bacteroidota bacterium]
MKGIYIVILSLGVVLIGCTKKQAMNLPIAPKVMGPLPEIPNTTVSKSALHYDPQTSLWTWNEQLFSGYAVRFHPDSTLQEKIGLLNGRKQNQAIQWYPDGAYKQMATYDQGKLHGEKKLWSPEPNHILLAHLHYHTGKAHGEQKKWYPSGELFKKLTLNMGREEGIQQAYRKNGALFANYEARDGRIFGLKRAALCYGLEDEKIQSDQ